MEITKTTPVSLPVQPRPLERVDPVRRVAPVGDAREAGADAAGRGPERRTLTVSDVVSRNLSIDPNTRQVVFQAINDRGEVVLQVPDQAILRLRAYAAEMRDATASAPGSLDAVA